MTRPNDKSQSNGQCWHREPAELCALCRRDARIAKMTHALERIAAAAYDAESLRTTWPDIVEMARDGLGEVGHE